MCAVRGAIKFGALPGGGWALLKVRERLSGSTDPTDRILVEVLCAALREPVERILANVGFNRSEAEKILIPIMENVIMVKTSREAITYDAFEHEHVNAVKAGLLDSTPAVLEAIRNSISIASLLGTLGGTVVFKRDSVLERNEAQNAIDYLRVDDEIPPEQRP